MTIAEFVADHARNGARAVSFEYGYLIKADGSRVLYPPGTLSKKRYRLRDNRCTYAIVEFPDGSKLEFNYNELNGAKYKVC